MVPSSGQPPFLCRFTSSLSSWLLPRAAGRDPAHLLFPCSKVRKAPSFLFRRRLRPSRPRHRNSKTGTLCSGMWLRFKDWYLRREAEFSLQETQRKSTKAWQLPFGTPVVIIALDAGGGLLETDVVETSEGGPADVFDGVIWHQELLLTAERMKKEGWRLAA